MYNRSANSRASIRSFLLPCLLFFRGSHTTSFATCGFSRSYNQVAQVPSSKVTCNSPRSPWIKSRMTFALVSITHSITIFPASFLTAIEILSLCTSMPIYLVLVIRVFLSGGVRAERSKPYSQRGSLLYCVRLPDISNNVGPVKHFLSRLLHSLIRVFPPLPAVFLIGAGKHGSFVI